MVISGDNIYSSSMLSGTTGKPRPVSPRVRSCATVGAYLSGVRGAGRPFQFRPVRIVRLGGSEWGGRFDHRLQGRLEGLSEPPCIQTLEALSMLSVLSTRTSLAYTRPTQAQIPVFTIPQHQVEPGDECGLGPTGYRGHSGEMRLLYTEPSLYTLHGTTISVQ